MEEVETSGSKVVGGKMSSRPACLRARASDARLFTRTLDDDLLHQCMHRALDSLTSRSSSLASLVSSASTSRFPAASSFAPLRYPFPTRACSRTALKIMASSVSGSAPASKVQQPEWIPPTSELPEPVLQVWNSLTKSKVRRSPLSSSYQK